MVFLPGKLPAHQKEIISALKELRAIYQDTSLSKQEQTESKAFEQYIKMRYRQQDENRM
jgi:Sec-independent protein translocase protein TatA